MSGAFPSRWIHSGPGFSGDMIVSAPAARSVVVLILEESRADFTPCFCARWNRVGARTRSAVCMYSSRPVRSSRYEFPVMPCSLGHTPQQMDVVLVFVTDGM